ncbi:ragulator complex protein LAMTOR1 isoform 1, partial [Tropilaelaps mercedesae]
GENNDTRGLLANPVSSASIQQSCHESYGSTNKIEDEESSELNRILQNTMAHVINISSLGHYMDSSETTQRGRQYHYKVDQLLSRTPYQKKARLSLLQEADLSKVLYWPAMSDQEFRQVEAVASLLNQALVDIQVESSEPLVVDFGTSL